MRMLDRPLVVSGELAWLGITHSPSFVGEPQCNGVIERFMPRDSIKFDRLAKPVKACIEAQERCSAFVFRPSRLEQQRTGSIFLDLMGFERTTIDRGWAAEVVLLMQDGRVAYKVMSGKPHIEGYHDDIQPLGPFQDLGVQAVHVSESML